MNDGTVTGTPLVLLVNDEEWTSRSLESILKPNGYAVLLSYTGKQSLELVSRVSPDVLLVDLNLPDMTAEELAPKLRKMRNVRPSTPVLFFTSGRVDRQRRIECLRSGAWQVLQPPFDPDELLVRLQRYVEAKQDADHALEQSQLDPVTGFYNVQGLLRRANEIAADATRSRRPLACVVLGPSSPDGHGTEDENADAGFAEDDISKRLANVLLATTRISDAIARVGETEFVILAPGTDPSGATRLAERLLEAVEAGTDENQELPPALRRLKAGVHAVTETEREAIFPEELLRKATTALRQVQGEENGSRLRRFELD